MNAPETYALAAALMAVDPAGLGGVCIRSQAHPVRDAWLRLLRRLLPEQCPIKRVPFNIDDGRLLGGLDLTATLKARRPICDRGVLVTCDGGLLVVAMAERVSALTAAAIASAIDAQEVRLLRDGLDERSAARVGIVAMDEGADEESLCDHLLDRLALVLEFDGLRATANLVSPYDVQQILAARELLPSVVLDDDVVRELCEAALALGIRSPRIALLAARVARVAAALDGRSRIETADAAVAGRLVLAPRATRMPAGDSDAENDAESDTAEPAAQTSAPEPPSPAADPPSPAADPPSPAADPPVTETDTQQAAQSSATAQTANDVTPERVLDAALASIPAGLLARLGQAGGAGRQGSASAGRSGQAMTAGRRGRPVGVRADVPRAGARLNVAETLRAAAPWQRVRGRDGSNRDVGGRACLRIHAEDLRVTRHEQRTGSLTIFAVDASGSSAANRLAEAKGAVELLLAECYIRRDQVAVIAFRSRKAEIVLPPTRSLVRAKRGLAGMAGGGGTPLADALAVAMDVGAQARRRGDTPTLVLLTDGQANVARSGAGGRVLAHAEAMTVSRSIRAAKMTTLFIDTAPRPGPLAAALATAMSARYFPLPFLTSKVISNIVRGGATANGR